MALGGAFDAKRLFSIPCHPQLYPMAWHATANNIPLMTAYRIKCRVPDYGILNVCYPTPWRVMNFQYFGEHLK